MEKSVLILGTSLPGIFWSSTGLGQTLPNKDFQNSFSDSVKNSLKNNVLNQPLAPDSSINSVGMIPTPIVNSPPVSTLARDLLPKDSGIRIESSQKFSSNLLSQIYQPETVADDRGEAKSKRKPFSIYFGSNLPDPTALFGPTRSPIVPASEQIRGGVSASAGVKINVSKPLKLFLEAKGGESVLGTDLSLFYGSDDLRNGVAVNVFGQQAYSPSFYGGKTKVKLPNGKDPWVERIGGGFEVRRELTTALQSTVGLTYQSIAVRNGLLGSKRQPVDQLGNPLTVSGSGRDDLLTLNLGLEYDTRDNPKNAVQGTHLRFGLDQSIPSGQANIGMTRLSASASQFFKLPFFTEKPSTFILNLQGGHILGDAPAYEAFNLGGDDTVRGYPSSDIGTGRSFLEASVEYRFPLFDLKVFKQPIDVGGVLFADYGSLLGTQNQVIGQPGVVRNKPGDGFGYGLGVRLGTRFGIIRLEAGFNEKGNIEPHLSLGERF